MADYKPEPDVLEVLSRSTCEGDALFLPKGQLERGLYTRVDKALTNAGGRWNRAARAHIFPTDAATKLATILDTGVAVDEKKRDQAFFSPPLVAEMATVLAEVQGKSVLEPEAGKGAIVQACNLAGARSVFAIEINPLHRDDLIRCAIGVRIADFLTVEPHDPLYDRVVMNPPFTKNQDIQHVEHALRFVKPKGVLVSVMFAIQQRKGFQRLVETYRPRIIELERGLFKDSLSQ